jgi:hypothetical protein
MPPGSTLSVQANDLYATAYPDSWYIEVRDGGRRIDRSIAFPDTHNAPVGGSVPSGNATVTLSYFDGPERFPASVAVDFSVYTPPPPPVEPAPILSYPIIVIYSASWATLIALVVVMVWLHKRRNRQKEEK